jgi:hypothetical protein
MCAVAAGCLRNCSFMSSVTSTCHVAIAPAVLRAGGPPGGLRGAARARRELDDLTVQLAPGLRPRSIIDILMCARGSTDVIPRTRLLARAHLAGDERASPQPLPAHTLAASSRAQEAASRARGVQRADARCQLLLYVCLTAAALRP